MLQRLVLAAVVAAIGGGTAASWRVALTDARGLTPHGVETSVVTHMGKRAVRLIGAGAGQVEAYAVANGASMEDGRIDVDVAGQPAPGADDGARGFVGIVFRLRADGAAFECFYLRPTNGRAGDQLRRNHATQYISFPDYPWDRLRKETPGVYESYVDLVPGEWTHVRVDVRDRRAALFVNRAAQPSLVVNDLKLPPAAGGIALWIGPGTEAWFRDLIVTR